MTDTPPPKGDQDLVRAAHVLKCLNYSVNENGVAMMVFQIATKTPLDDARFAITIPVGGLKQLRTLVNDLITLAEKRKLGAGMAAMHKPREVTVGHSDMIRGCVALSFNPNAEDEAVFLIPDELGLDISDGLQSDIFGRMTDQERRARIAKKSRLLTPPAPKFILPGGG